MYICVCVCVRVLFNKQEASSNSVSLLRSLSVKYPWEKYETTYPPSCGSNNKTTVRLECLILY